MQVKRRFLCLEDRIKILELLDAGEPACNVADRFKISPSAISHIKKKKEKILRSKTTIAACNGNLRKRRCTQIEENPLEKAVYEWLVQQTAMGMPVRGLPIKKQALLFNKMLGGPESFKASDGWLTKFKKRHGVKSFSLQEEKRCADVEASEEFQTEMCNMINVTAVPLDNIYNCDETGLYWKMLPDGTLSSGDNKKGSNRIDSSERVTVMICTNVSGTHTLPLYIIGDSEKPRCFKGIKQLPVVYENEKNALMTKELMMDWYTTVFIPEVKKKHSCNEDGDSKIILIMDNAPCHPAEQEFNAVSDFCTVLFFPRNVSPLLQPTEQGIVEKLKKCYKAMLLTKIIAEDLSQGVEKVLQAHNLLDCCHMCALAWKQVTPSDIRNCWRKLIPVEKDSTLSEEMEIIDAATFHSLLSRIPGREDLQLKDTNRWLNADAREFGWQVRSDRDLAQDSSVEDNQEYTDSIDEAPEHAEIESESSSRGIESPCDEASAKEILKALSVVTQWVQKTDGDLAFLEKCQIYREMLLM